MTATRALRLVVAALVAAAVLPVAVLLAPPAGAASFTVTTTDDEVSANGQTSLREAISQSSATTNQADTVTLQAGATYVLDLCDADPLVQEDANASGDLDHTDNNAGGGLTIEGNGATIEQTCVGERVLDVRFLQPLTLRDVTITGGDADLAGDNNAHGGGIRGNGPWTIEDSTFTDNEADGIGSAIENGGSDATVTIRRSQIVDNGPGLHGAVRLTFGLVVEDSTISGNESTGLYGLQGLSVTGSTISGNAGQGIGAVNGTVSVEDSTITGNGSNLEPAGGIRVATSAVNVTNSTIVANTGSVASGIYATGASAFDLDFVTLTGTTAVNLHNTAGTTSLHGVVLGTPLGAAGCVGGMSVTSVGSFDPGSTCGLAGPNNLSGGGDPLLGALGANGRATQTRAPGFGSPVVDLVPEGLCSKAVDQRGSVRPIDGDFDGEDECDAGAVERPQGQPFTDVGAGHPFFTEIGWMAWNGISTGSQPGPTYEPSDPVSRQAMSAFLYRLADATFVGGTPTFWDVPASNPFFDEIEWMNDEGITTGFPGGLFQPTASVTRQSMSAFMHRLAGEPAGPFPDPGFSDVSAGHPFYEEIAWMADAGVTEGYPDGTYRPSTSVSRQAMSAFMFRFAALL